MSSMPAVSPSAPVLLFVQGAEQRRIVIDHTPFTIGRKADRDLPIPDSRVSGEHASIVAEEGRYYIVDQGGREKDVGEKYATMVVVRLWADGRLELLNCGHVPPRLVSEGKVSEPDNVNPAIGLLPDVSFHSMRMQLKPGDRLFLTTDGVVEAENAAGEFFGYERLDDAAAGAGFEGVFRAVKEFCGSCPLQDDCTVVELLYSAAKAAGVES